MKILAKTWFFVHKIEANMDALSYILKHYYKVTGPWLDGRIKSRHSIKICELHYFNRSGDNQSFCPEAESAEQERS